MTPWRKSEQGNIMDQSLKRNNVFDEGQLLISARIKRIEHFKNIEHVSVCIRNTWSQWWIWKNKQVYNFVRSDLGLWCSHKVVIESVISFDEHILQQSKESPHSSPLMASPANLVARNLKAFYSLRWQKTEVVHHKTPTREQKHWWTSMEIDWQHGLYVKTNQEPWQTISYFSHAESKLT